MGLPREASARANARLTAESPAGAVAPAPTADLPLRAPRPAVASPVIGVPMVRAAPREYAFSLADDIDSGTSAALGRPRAAGDRFPTRTADLPDGAWRSTISTSAAAG